MIFDSIAVGKLGDRVISLTLMGNACEVILSDDSHWIYQWRNCLTNRYDRSGKTVFSTAFVRLCVGQLSDLRG
jgi:hypothetical protein